MTALTRHFPLPSIHHLSLLSHTYTQSTRACVCLTSAPQLSDCTDLGRGERKEERKGEETREERGEGRKRRGEGWEGISFFLSFPLSSGLKQDRGVSVTLSTSAEDIRPVYFSSSSPLLRSFFRVNVLSADWGKHMRLHVYVFVITCQGLN